MTKFLIRIGIATAIAAALHLSAALLADGTFDPFYLRFTTPARPSLIIGTSRAAQGIVPSELKSVIADLGFQGPMLNFAFTLLHSPYGPVYFDAVKEKLAPDTRNGLFIAMVDPFPLSTPSPTPNDPATFREAKSRLSRMKGSINGTHPNLSYFFGLTHGWGAILTSRLDYLRHPRKRLHADGWLEITVPHDPKNTRIRFKRKLADFKKNATQFRPSAARREYFEKTVCLLTKHGTVFIVRMPAWKQLITIENQLMPDFDEFIQGVSNRCGAPFEDFSGDGKKYEFTDGSHLYKTGARAFTRDLAARIRSLSR